MENKFTSQSTIFFYFLCCRSCQNYQFDFTGFTFVSFRLPTVNIVCIIVRTLLYIFLTLQSFVVCSIVYSLVGRKLRLVGGFQRDFVGFRVFY